MSFLEKQKDFVRFIISTPNKKQAKLLLVSADPQQNSALREIIFNIGALFPQRYLKLKKKIKKPLTKHFLNKHWENLLEFLKEHSLLILDVLDEETSIDSPRQIPADD